MRMGGFGITLIGLAAKPANSAGLQGVNRLKDIHWQDAAILGVAQGGDTGFTVEAIAIRNAEAVIGDDPFIFSRNPH